MQEGSVASEVSAGGVGGVRMETKTGSIRVGPNCASRVSDWN